MYMYMRWQSLVFCDLSKRRLLQAQHNILQYDTTYYILYCNVYTILYIIYYVVYCILYDIVIWYIIFESAGGPRGRPSPRYTINSISYVSEIQTKPCFFSHFISITSLRFSRVFSAAWSAFHSTHVVTLFVSSEVLKRRLLKWWSDHPVKTGSLSSDEPQAVSTPEAPVGDGSKGKSLILKGNPWF